MVVGVNKKMFLKGFLCGYCPSFFGSSIRNDSNDNGDSGDGPPEGLLLQQLSDVSIEARYRAEVEQEATLKELIPSTLQTIRFLCLYHGYTPDRVERYCRDKNFHIWLYGVKPSMGHEEPINLITRFQKHFLVNVFLGSQTSFETHLQQKMGITRDLTDAGFEKK